MLRASFLCVTPLKQCRILRHFLYKCLMRRGNGPAALHPDDLIQLRKQIQPVRNQQNNGIPRQLPDIGKNLRLVFLSSAENGSSRIITGRRWHKVRASASRCA